MSTSRKTERKKIIREKYRKKIDCLEDFWNKYKDLGQKLLKRRKRQRSDFGLANNKD